MHGKLTFIIVMIFSLHVKNIWTLRYIVHKMTKNQSVKLFVRIPGIVNSAIFGLY